MCIDVILENWLFLISKLSLSEIKKLIVTGGCQIPTLVEVLDVINRKCIVNIELKGLGTAIETCKVVKHYVENEGWSYDDFIVSSFQQKLIQAVFDFTKKIQIGVLTEVALKESLEFAKSINAKAIHPDYTLLTKANVEHIKEEGYKVYTWGIITDFPDRI